MAKTKIDFDTVRKIALEMPGVEDSRSYGSPSLKVHGELMAAVPVNKAAEPNSVGVRVDFERRSELLEAAPDIYYAPEHYRNYPMVLVRLSRIDLEALRDLLLGAHRFVTSKSPARKGATRKQKAPKAKPTRR
jgi:hypothetical protein